MKLLLLFIGKTTESYLKEGIEEYISRLSKYINVSAEVLPASDRKSKDKAIEEEGTSVLSRLKPGDFVVVLDERGKSLTSRQLAAAIQKWMLRSIGRVVIVTGGAYGISPAIMQRSQFIISLSPMTFTHQMVRLILAEQLYRAMTIIKNEGYHHD